jgi:hypothetical protein
MFVMRTDERVVSPEGVVGRHEGHSVFAKLISNNVEGFHCDATDTEQSLGIFSPSACVLYGLEGIVLSRNGSHPDGAITFTSLDRTIKLCAYSSALLQVKATSGNTPKPIN